MDEPAISVYPNPAKEEVKIITPPNSEGNLIILNTLGQVVFSQDVQIQNRKTGIDTKEWANGLYVMLWHGVDGKIMSAKLMKN